MLILVGVAPGDGPGDVQWLAEKCVNLRIFADTEGRMNRSLLETGGGALVVSQFTLYGDSRKGRRPSFVRAAPPEVAKPLYRALAARLRALGVRPVETGTFGAHMRVDLVNYGPVTLIVDTLAGGGGR